MVTEQYFEGPLLTLRFPAKIKRPRPQWRNLMELILIIVLVVLVFGGGGYWGRSRGHW